MTRDEILQAALDLPLEERLTVARELALSIPRLQDEQFSEPECEAAWIEEVDRRIREVWEGKVHEIPGEDVMARARALLRSSRPVSPRRLRRVSAFTGSNDPNGNAPEREAEEARRLNGETPEPASAYDSTTMNLDRITTNPKVMGGKPCIRGMRVTAGTVVGLVATGHTREEILELYPYLEEQDIRQALSYAAWRAEEVEVPLASA